MRFGTLPLVEVMKCVGELLFPIFVGLVRNKAEGEKKEREGKPRVLFLSFHIAFPRMYWRESSTVCVCGLLLFFFSFSFRHQRAKHGKRSFHGEAFRVCIGRRAWGGGKHVICVCVCPTACILFSSFYLGLPSPLCAPPPNPTKKRKASVSTEGRWLVEAGCGRGLQCFCHCV